MNLIDTFRDLFAQVPDLLQPLIVAVAGAIPFVEGEVGAAIGILGGIHPATAISAGIVGNFACVAMLVLTGAQARDAVTSRRDKASRQGARKPRSQADEDLDFALDLALDPAESLAVDLVAPEEDADERRSRRWVKFQHAFDRYGVPGVSLLGPLLLPTHFTAIMLAASGISRSRILIWQAVAIIGWTVLVGLILTGVVSVVH